MFCLNIGVIKELNFGASLRNSSFKIAYASVQSSVDILIR